jgi:hypothetical protein
MNSSAEVPKKKVYRTPSLKTYGSLTEMTASGGNMGQDDNATKAKLHKTG